MSENSSKSVTASPISTGGAGTFFEQHVAAYWLAQLLVRGIPPILIKTVVAGVHFQTEHLGWQTDDFLIVCERSGTSVQKLAGQVKLNFTVSAADDDCKRAIQDFWRDFKSSERFSPADDRLVLVTLRGTNTLLKDFVSLLDCARAVQDSTEFERRLSVEGFISDRAIKYCGELQKIVGACEERPVSMADVWPFLRVLHVLSLDLHTSTRQTEAQIKSLLAHTATEGEPLEVADASWNALLAIASNGMTEARRLRREDLPAELQQRHASLGTREQRVLRALGDHTDIILRGIRSTIGPDLHLQRSALVQKVLGELETAQVVLVSGAAGSGKSAIGKDAVSLLLQDHFAFGFRVEEFAQPHFDATLNAGQIPANTSTLGAILGAQSRKVVLVESVERLLERTTRDAFSDLMTLAADDGGMRVLLTCRDYSIDQVRASFLEPAGITHTVIEVPPLEDAELAEVEAALPSLKYPLRNPALRNILRNPYFLDKALAISWSAERPVPESEREFRTLFWREIVRAGNRVPEGMARRREAVFQEVAIRRARALAAHVVCNDLDPDVIGALRNDSLLDSPPDNLSLVATAHDVLEDWAILQWLDEQHLTGEGSLQHLAGAIGAHPAVRRSYRKWVAELVERDPDAADRLFRAAITEPEISAHFRDDTLVSLLRAGASPEFLLRHEAQLLANNRALLKRVIHLLRVACVTTASWHSGTAVQGSISNVPDGPSWATVLRLVHRNLDGFPPDEHPLLLKLIEDAIRNVSWRTPRVDGEESVAAICHWLLERFDNYRFNEARKRVLRVIAKIPKADPVRFEGVLCGTVKGGQRRNKVAEEFRKIVLGSLDGMLAARDLPDLLVSVATEYLLAAEEHAPHDRHGRSSFGLGIHFGIGGGLSQEFSPASALRGPWVSLLHNHPRKGLDFLIKVFNHSADWYVHPRVDDPLEPARQIELTFADGMTRKHWGNQRLWNLYRGTSVGPGFLQSLLMACEKWLLELAETSSEHLDGVLLEVLRRSDSATLAAVVASVATAHPHASGEALLVLLSAPDYIIFDRRRMAGEHHASSFSGRADDWVFDQERKEANSLAHRRHDLETAITNLQLGPFAPRVHAILDRHLATLPPKAEQDESHLIWRLALHRMDVRQYTISDISESEAPGSGTSEGEPAKRYFRFQSKALDPDVQVIVDESAAEIGAMNARLAVLMWGTQAFERGGREHDPSRWREMLESARKMDLNVEQPDGSRDAPGLVAAVCVRDQWEKMSSDQQDWCVGTVCSEVLRQADSWNPLNYVQWSIMGADRACASVVSSLLYRPLTPPQMLRVREAFAAALTHPVERVRWSATRGVDTQFWTNAPILAKRCVDAVATEVMLTEHALHVEKSRPYEERRKVEEIAAAAAMAVRERFWEDGYIAEDAYKTVDISKGFGALAAARILSILGQVPTEPATIAAFAQATRTLVEWWNTDDETEHGNERHFDAEADISKCLRDFLMRTTSAPALEVLQPILDAIDRHPGEIDSIVDGLTAMEDERPNTPQYWFLWELFAESVKQAGWVSYLDDEDSEGSEMLSAIFLTRYWKDNVRHWRSLEGYAHHVHHLFEALPPSSIVLDDYLRFLYHVGEQSLPEAFVRVANALNQGNAQAMLKQANTVFLFEVLLQRHVYGRPLELKRHRDIREGVLVILDFLVEAGSSAAFRMRDDFVTPVMMA